MSKKPAGFTLIELLIVIFIISILSLVGLVSYTNFLKNSRDSKRQADLKFIQSALEEYHSDQLYYPLASGSCSNGRFTINCPLRNSAATKTYISTLPADPVSSNPQYTYQPLPSGCDNSATMCTSYCLFVALEGTNRPTSDTACSPTSPRNYGITKP